MKRILIIIALILALSIPSAARFAKYEHLKDISPETNSQIEELTNSENIESIENQIIESSKITDEKLEIPLPEQINCKHNDKFEDIIKKPTCTETGIKHVICNDCGELIFEEAIKMVAHDFSPHRKEATCEEDGEIYNICNSCGYKETIGTIKKLEHKTKEVIITERSCLSDGEIHIVCEVCGKTISVEKPAQYNHQWIWDSEVFPTPISEGTITYRCYHCGNKKTEPYLFEQVGDANLTIPTLRLNKEIVLADCNQQNTDKYDISIDMNFINSKNPVIFGHNTRSLGRLYEVEAGDLIYLTIDGVTSVYKVTISEEGQLINGGTNIKGITSGTLCMSQLEIETLHFFTCYKTPFNPNGRWIVLAEKIEQS